MNEEKQILYPIKFRKDVTVYKSYTEDRNFDAINSLNPDEMFFIKTSNGKAPKKFSDIFDTVEEVKPI